VNSNISGQPTKEYRSHPITPSQTIDVALTRTYLLQENKKATEEETGVMSPLW